MNSYLTWSAAASLIVLFVLLSYRKTYPPISPWRKAALATLRMAAFLLLSLLVLDPVSISKRFEEKKPIVAILIDQSRSMAVKDAGNISRFDAALEDANRVAERLVGSGARVQDYIFSKNLSRIPLDSIGAIVPDGDGTDILGALRELENELRGEVTEAVLILSDGRSTRALSPSSFTPSAKVFAVGYGDTARASNIQVQEVVADRIAYTGTEFPIEAMIKSEGCRGKRLEVRLLEDGMAVSSLSYSISTEEDFIGARFSRAFEKEGTKNLEIIALSNCSEGERGDNKASLKVEVKKAKLRILYIDRFPDWNTSFLSSFVARSKRFEADIVTYLPGAGFVENTTRSAFLFPATPVELSRYDLIVVSEDGGIFSDARNVEILSKYIESGGAAIFLADEASPITSSASLSILGNLLPIRAARTPRVEYGEIFVRLAPGSEVDPFILGSDLGSAIGTMPPLTAFISGIEVTSGARVPLAIERASANLPFLAIERRDKGMVAVVLAFPLWRWKLFGNEGERVYESFMGGLFQYMAEGSKSPSLTLDANRTFYRSGERIDLRVYIGERNPPDVIKGRVEMVKEGEEAVLVSTMIFEPDARRKGLFSAFVDGLQAGKYLISADEIHGDRTVATGSISVSVEPVSVELLDVSRDSRLLRKVALGSGGEYLERSSLMSVVDKLDLSPRILEKTITRDLRSFLAMFALIVTILAIEWIARKLWGLV